ncbi:MAG: hypothetical protein LBD21_06905 [Tannerellaceae bacterium]|jgi:hypothetical protein|nr:hypothetical protein [Tannerellaceae bacterium]
MSASQSKIQSIIETAFASALKEQISNENGNIVSSLYVQADAESGELQLYDDAEHLVKKLVIFDWVHSKEETFYKKVTDTLKPMFKLLVTKGMFNSPYFLKPLTVSLTDEEFNTIEELLVVEDDDLFKDDDPFLKNLEADLDNFLKELLADMPK